VTRTDFKGRSGIKQLNTLGQLTDMWYTDDTSASRELYRLHYVYDAYGKLSSILYNGQVIISYTYNPNGTIANSSYGNGIQIGNSYTKEVLTTQMTAGLAGRILYNQSFSYDEVGNQTSSNHTDLFTMESVSNHLKT